LAGDELNLLNRNGEGERSRAIPKVPGNTSEEKDYQGKSRLSLQTTMGGGTARKGVKETYCTAFQQGENNLNSGHSNREKEELAPTHTRLYRKLTFPKGGGKSTSWNHDEVSREPREGRGRKKRKMRVGVRGSQPQGFTEKTDPRLLREYHIIGGAR